jgi:hypothetical protein
MDGYLDIVETTSFEIMYCFEGDLKKKKTKKSLVGGLKKRRLRKVLLEVIVGGLRTKGK